MFHNTTKISLALLLIGFSVVRASQQSVLMEQQLRNEYYELLHRLDELTPTTPYIVINTHENVLLLKDEGQILRSAVCATGSGRKLEGPKSWKHDWHFETPKGAFSVLRKVKNPIWIKPEWAFLEAGEEIPIFAEDKRRFEFGALGSYALYFAKGYMIHGTIYEINLGKDITHGCVRIGETDLKYFYDHVETGCPVFIY